MERTCEMCEHYAICSAECHDMTAEAINCGWYKPRDEQVVCERCKYLDWFDGRIVRARFVRTGASFLRFDAGSDAVVLDPKLHTCREAVPKSQTSGKEGEH